MRKFDSLRLLLVLVLGTTPVAQATGPNIKFDQGIDATGIVDHVRKQERRRQLKPLPPPVEFNLPRELSERGIADVQPRVGLKAHEESSPSFSGPLPLPDQVACEMEGMSPSLDDPGGETIDLCGSAKSKDRIPTIGMNLAPITGPYEPLITGNEKYVEGLALKERLGTVGEGIRLSRNLIDFGKGVALPVRNLLLDRWKNQVEVPKSDLISKARPLDAKDEKLSQSGDRLIVWNARGARRGDVLEGHKKQFESLCVGELPEDAFEQCVDFESRLRSCIEAHNTSFQKLQKLAATWLRSKECLEEDGKTFREKVGEWVDERILPWIALTLAALRGDGKDNSCDLDRVELANPDNPDDRHSHCIYTCHDYPIEEGCGLSANFPESPTPPEIDEKCPDPFLHPPVQCPPPWEMGNGKNIFL